MAWWSDTKKRLHTPTATAPRPLSLFKQRIKYKSLSCATGGSPGDRERTPSHIRGGSGACYPKGTLGRGFQIGRAHV